MCSVLQLVLHSLVVLTSNCLPRFSTALEVVQFATRAYSLVSDISWLPIMHVPYYLLPVLNILMEISCHPAPG